SRFAATPPQAPFLIHAGEGTDEASAAEIYQLHALGVLTDRSVLIHAVGFDDQGWRLIRETGAGVVWCPRSNAFTLGRTLAPERLACGVPIALGTDSGLTTEGDLLDEIRAARELAPDVALRDAAALLRLPPQPQDWIAAPAFGEPPELVVIDGSIRLIGMRLARVLPPRVCREFFPLQIETRPRVLVRWNVPRMLQETAQHLGSDIRLAGRRVAA
ncbi:MAG TPA: hypothetical protein VGJ09_15905, partial [Bryobacteraceae bacterium]